MAKVIGKVSATEKCPSTIDEFYFWTDKNRFSARSMWLR